MTEALQSLAEKNLVNYEPYKGASLTDEGKKIAETIKRRHRLLEVFLADVLHINRTKVHDKHAGWNITISEDTENTLAGCSTPRPVAPISPISPCTKGIGSGSECDAVTASALPLQSDLRTSDIIPITDLGAQEKGTIAFIRGL